MIRVTIVRNFLLQLILALSLFACSIKDSSEALKLEKADLTLLKNFNINLTGEPKYQFYEKYGFTDIEEHLILILKSPVNFQLQNKLPFDSVSLSELRKIQTQKLIDAFWMELNEEKEFFSDIRLEAKEYFTGEIDLHFNEGSYQIKKQDGIETIMIFDKKSKHLFIEIKKEHKY